MLEPIHGLPAEGNQNLKRFEPIASSRHGGELVRQELALLLYSSSVRHEFIVRDESAETQLGQIAEFGIGRGDRGLKGKLSGLLVFFPHRFINGEKVQHPLFNERWNHD